MDKSTIYLPNYLLDTSLPHKTSHHSTGEYGWSQGVPGGVRWMHWWYTVSDRGELSVGRRWQPVGFHLWAERGQRCPSKPDTHTHTHNAENVCVSRKTDDSHTACTNRRYILYIYIMLGVHASRPLCILHMSVIFLLLCLWQLTLSNLAFFSWLTPLHMVRAFL